MYGVKGKAIYIHQRLPDKAWFGTWMTNPDYLASAKSNIEST